jgi:hypothetical protein
VTLLEEDLGRTLVQGEPQGTADYYIDSATGQLVGMEQYSPASDGHKKVAEIEDIRYGVDITSDTFEASVPEDDEVVDGTFEVKDQGYIVFHGMGRAADYDPRATTLYDRAQVVRHWVTMGVLPWQDLENAYLAVLKQDPNHSGARTYLGRFYTRWGYFNEALDLLPAGDGYWSDLNRAFCYDALGKRSEALDIYTRLQGAGHDSVAEWAKLGLEKPTWPADLPITAEPGEMRLRANASWHVSASHSAFHAEPKYAIDGDRSTQWTNGGGHGLGHEQSPGQWFELDFDSPVRLTRVVLDHYGEINMYVNNWPRGVAAFATEDGANWFSVAASQGDPRHPVTVRFDEPRSLRGIKFVATERHDPEWWGIYEVFVFGPTG